MKLKFELKGLNKQTLPKPKGYIAAIMREGKDLFVPDWLKQTLTFAKNEDVVEPDNFIHPDGGTRWIKYELKKI